MSGHSLVGPFLPTEVPLHEWGSGPPSNTWLLEPTRATSQTASWSVNPVFQGSQAWRTDRQTTPLCNSGPDLASAAWRPNHNSSCLVCDSCIGVWQVFFPIVDTWLSCEDIARQSYAMVPKWLFFGSCIWVVTFLLYSLMILMLCRSRLYANIFRRWLTKTLKTGAKW